MKLERDTFLGQWTPRIGPKAAHANYEYQKLRKVAPVAGLLMIAVSGVLSIFSAPAAVAVGTLFYFVYVIAAIRSIRHGRVARKSAKDFLRVELQRGRSVPIRSTEQFDRWQAERANT